jgi:outer membrane receptor protein involved in Fe transport
VGLEALYTGRRLTLAGDVLPGFLLANLTLLARPVLQRLSVSATVTNLFDQTYSDPASTENVQDAIRQDGRAFRLHAVIRF